MKILIPVIGVVFLAVIAALEIWKRLVPDRSKLVKRIEISLVILMFVGGAVGLIRQAVSPSKEEIITETVDAVLKKGTVPVKELKVAYEEIGKLKEQLTKAVERAMELEKSGDVPEAEGIIEELRKSGDVSRLLEVLVKDRDVHRDELIERNQEIAVIAYLKGDIDIAMEAVNEILKVLPEDLFALNRRGIIHSLQGKLKESECDFKRVLELANEKGNNKDRAVALSNLGNVYYKRGELDKAEDMNLKSLEIAEKLGFQEMMASDYGNLGLIYRLRGELDKAEEMHNKSLEINKKLGRLEGMASQYGNLGIVYKTRGELDKAEEMHLKSLEINEKLGRLEGVAGNYGNLGNVYQMRGKLDKAEGMQKKALEIDKEIERLEGQAIRYANLGLIYKQRGDIGKAKEYWEKAVGLYKRIGMPREVEAVQGWIEGIGKGKK